MKMYFGVVEDRNDPLMIGRVRVRVHGIHTHEKTLVSTMDLPWSTVIMPVTTAGLGGFGDTPSLVEGTSVVGLFTDNDKQQFMVLGVNQGISQDGFIENEKGELYANTVEAGFNDPRRNSESDYKDTAEDTTPAHAPNRAYGMKFGLDFYPALLKTLEFNYFGKRKTVSHEMENDKKVIDNKPYYPLITNASDINTFSAQLDAKDSHKVLQRDLSNLDMGEHLGKVFKFEGVTDEVKKMLEIDARNRDPEVELESTVKFPDDSHIKPRYPFNKATFTESGHLFELDDTKNYERVSLQHRRGTYFEWGPHGDAIQRVAKDNYTVVCGDNNLWVSGNVNIRVMGDANLHANGNVNVKGYQSGKIDVSKDLHLRAGTGNLTLESATAVVVKSPLFVPNGNVPDEGSLI
tara:strand:+ start:2257 stop:3471 length:1215 start_codon:yes stop_codon:yes gene_type:complete